MYGIMLEYWILGFEETPPLSEKWFKAVYKSGMPPSIR